MGYARKNLVSLSDIDSEAWEILVSRRGIVLGRAMGRLDVMRLNATTLSQSWVRGVRNAERCYSCEYFVRIHPSIS